MSHEPQQYGMESQFEQQPGIQATAQGGGGWQGSQGFAEGGQQGGTTPQAGGMGGTTQGVGLDVKLDDALTDQMRVALHDLVAAAHACEWCAERCIDEGPEMAECIRLCRDVADLASLNARLITRDSVFGPDAAEVFVAAADACAQECARHHHRHCQECAEVLPRAVRSVRTMLETIGGTGTQFQGGTGQFQQGSSGMGGGSVGHQSGMGGGSVGHQSGMGGPGFGQGF